MTQPVRALATTRRPCGLGSGRRPRLSRRVSLHARHPADDVPRAAVDDAAVRRLRHRRRIEPPLPVSARPGRQRPERRLRPADADGLRLRPSARRRRSRPRRRRHRLDRGHGRAVRRHPARRGLDVDDDQRDGDHPAGALRRRRQAAGRAARDARRARCRTTSSRNTSRAAPTSIRPAPSLRIVTDIFAFCERELPELEHDLDQRLSHPRGGIDGGAGGGVHLRQRDRLRRRRRVDAGLDVNPFGQRLSFFFNAHNDFLEEIAKFRAARRLWARHHARPLRRHQPARAAAPLPHADGRQHADRAAARQQHRPRRAAGAGRRARRHAVAALQRARRGARRCRPRSRRAIALRTQQIIAARERRRQHRRPGRRRVRDRGADRRASSAGAEALLDAHRRRRRHAGGDRNRADPARDPGVGLPRAAGHRLRRRGRRRREQVRGSTAATASARSTCSASTRRSSGGRSRACARCAPARDADALARGDRRGRRPRRATGSNLVPPIIAAVEAQATVGEICGCACARLRRASRTTRVATAD